MQAIRAKMEESVLKLKGRCVTVLKGLVGNFAKVCYSTVRYVDFVSEDLTMTHSMSQ